jgi:hypothetical protein
LKENKNIVYCLLGSFILAMLTNPIFEFAESVLYFDRGYGTPFYGPTLHRIISILSGFGFLMLIIFSVVLILNNIRLKK